MDENTGHSCFVPKLFLTFACRKDYIKYKYMRSRTANWFETKLSYEKMIEDGMQKKVVEPYVVDALSFAEAENTIINEMSAYVSGELKVTGIAQAAYHEVFFSDVDTDDKWYKAKLQFITLDEKTNTEKRSNVNYLVQAKSLPVAVKYIDEVMGGTMIDYVVASITETKIMDVYEHQAPVKQAEAGGE